MTLARFTQLELILALSFWLAYTGYFGWNLRAINENEVICDWITIGLLIFNVLLNLLRVADAIKEARAAKSRAIAAGMTPAIEGLYTVKSQKKDHVPKNRN